MLLAHIIIATASIGLFASRVFSQNSKLQLAASISIIATLATGAILTLSQTTPLSHACISGVIYLVSVIALSRVATFAQARSKINR
jgi:hypothetical protein